MNATHTPVNTEPRVSLVIPVYNEGDAIVRVLEETTQVLEGLSCLYEVIVVNDGSNDNTVARITACSQQHPGIRWVSLSHNSGQSAAFGVGFRECRGRVVVLMDGDGQNDPHDIPMLLEGLRECDACCGYRVRRCDTWSKRVASRLANRVRQWVLRDDIEDTGCSLKAVRAEFIEDLPMQFCGMHRFLPALWQMQGARIRQIPVNHRARAGGQSKYNNLDRLKESIRDLWAVCWMRQRYRPVHVLKGENCT